MYAIITYYIFAVVNELCMAGVNGSSVQSVASLHVGVYCVGVYSVVYGIFLCLLFRTSVKFWVVYK